MYAHGEPAHVVNTASMAGLVSRPYDASQNAAGPGREIDPVRRAEILDAGGGRSVGA